MSPPWGRDTGLAFAPTISPADWAKHLTAITRDFEVEVVFELGDWSEAALRSAARTRS